MNKGKTVGILFLASIILGVVIYQILQGPILFADDFLTATSDNKNHIITSTVLGLLNGLITIVIAVLMLPVFKQYNFSLTFLYLSFTIANFVMIAIDNVSVLSILELSLNHSKYEVDNVGVFGIIGELLYQKHWWTHYMSLLSSSFYMFTFYLLFYQSKLIPKFLSLFGLIAVSMMFIEILSSIFGQSIGIILMLPLGIAQLSLVVWLLIKGINQQNNTK
ncbi:MAG: hypothetical protein COB01_01460 [Lutibacter sp.]|nr:MAG: hypothetical protein COB01_01460 [Lutibacter sp.]